MADPRKVLNYNEIRPVRLTFKIDNSTITYSASAAGGSVSVGLAVKLSGNGTVALAADGDAVIGLLVSVEKDLFCTVHVGGVAKFKGGTAATLTAGQAIVGALRSAAAGYVKIVTTGSVAAGIAGKGRILDSSDADAVYVLLD